MYRYKRIKEDQTKHINRTTLRYLTIKMARTKGRGSLLKRGKGKTKSIIKVKHVQLTTDLSR